MESFGHKMFISSQPVPLMGRGVLYPRVRDFSLQHFTRTVRVLLSEQLDTITELAARLIQRDEKGLIQLWSSSSFNVSSDSSVWLCIPRWSYFLAYRAGAVDINVLDILS